MYLAMSDAIDDAQSNPAIRCLVLTGRSGVFTAGNDIGDVPGRDGGIRRWTANETPSSFFNRC